MKSWQSLFLVLSSCLNIVDTLYHGTGAQDWMWPGRGADFAGGKWTHPCPQNAQLEAMGDARHQACPWTMDMATYQMKTFLANVLYSWLIMCVNYPVIKLFFSSKSGIIYAFNLVPYQNKNHCTQCYGIVVGTPIHSRCARFYSWPRGCLSWQVSHISLTHFMQIGHRSSQFILEENFVSIFMRQHVPSSVQVHSVTFQRSII